MHDVRTRAPDEPHQLDQAQEIAHRVGRPPHMAQWYEPDARGLCRIDERAVAVCRDHDVEVRCQGRKERGDVRSRPAYLGERDQDEDPRPAALRAAGLG